MTVVSQIVILIFVHYNYLLETTVQSLFTSIACKFLGLGPVVLFFSELMVSELSLVSAFVVDFFIIHHPSVTLQFRRRQYLVVEIGKG